MVKNKKEGKIIARITAPQLFHLQNRTKKEKRTASDIIRELIENDKEKKVSGLSLKSLHEKKRRLKQMQ